MNFNDIEPKEYSKETFGRCIRARREELGLSAKIFAGKIGMSPVYLSDIECGKRRAPTGANSGVDYLANMIRELEIPEEQVHAFYTMAEATYSRYGNINSYLVQYKSSNPMQKALQNYSYFYTIKRKGPA